MATETIKDSNHRVIAYIETDSSGDKIIRDRNHVTKGYYKKSKNETRDRNHKLVGYGDQLLTLI